jgi:hypothetical protein
MKLAAGISNITTKIPISEKEADCLVHRYVKEKNLKVI